MATSPPSSRRIALLLLLAAFCAPCAVRELGSLTTGSLVAVHAARSAPVVIGTWESAVNAPEIVRIAPDTGTRILLSNFNSDRAANIDWQPLQEFWFTTSRGARIHSFVALPPAFDASRKYPLFVVVHGAPHSMWIDQFVIRWDYHLLAQPGRQSLAILAIPPISPRSTSTLPSAAPSRGRSNS